MTRTMVIKRCTFVGLSILLIAQASIAQTVELFTESQLKADLHALNSKQWQQREAAFYDLVLKSREKADVGNFAPADSITFLARAYPASSELLKIGIIQTLAAENLVVASQQSLPEEFTDYYGDLIMAVSSLRDVRSVGPLVDAVNTGGMAMDALSALGDASLNGTVAALKTKTDEESQINLTEVLSRMARPGRVNAFTDPASVPKLKAALVGQAQHALPSVRAHAVKGLGEFSDSSIKSILQQIAESDPYSVSPSGKTLFPVRTAAQKAIAKQ